VPAIVAPLPGLAMTTLFDGVPEAESVVKKSAMGFAF
jgi:hypothetical protein